jgi:hypothetical protein
MPEAPPASIFEPLVISFFSFIKLFIAVLSGCAKMTKPSAADAKP